MKAFVDNITPQFQDKPDGDLAQVIYASGTHLLGTHNRYWREAFKPLRSALTLPSRHSLGGPFLVSEYAKVMTQVKAKSSPFSVSPYLLTADKTHEVRAI